MSTRQKSLGAYYTPPEVAAALVHWAVRRPQDRLLDPACGDGRFLARHPRSTGVDCDEAAISAATEAAPQSVLHAANFFEWALSTRERFECAAGNPPFIRYQRFAGATRELARNLCASLGARVSGLTSSWVPYLIATASLLRKGGRMAFVVPAEIGHAPYAGPLLSWLTTRFENVRVVAIREKVFRELSEDVWLLFADGFGGSTEALELSVMDRFDGRFTVSNGTRVSLEEWRRWRCRLRPMLLPDRVRAEYRRLLDLEGTSTLGDFARVGIGYVSGDNDFFHLRPSKAQDLNIPDTCLAPTVRRGRDLKNGPITGETVAEWRRDDAPNFLLRLGANLPDSRGVRRHLDSEAGRNARLRYKCRVRRPWYSVPNVTAPDLFLPYMSSAPPNLVENRAGCVCTNAVHAVHPSGPHLTPGAPTPLGLGAHCSQLRDRGTSARWWGAQTGAAGSAARCRRKRGSGPSDGGPAERRHGHHGDLAASWPNPRTGAAGSRWRRRSPDLRIRREELRARRTSDPFTGTSPAGWSWKGVFFPKTSLRDPLSRWTTMATD